MSKRYRTAVVPFSTGDTIQTKKINVESSMRDFFVGVEIKPEPTTDVSVEIKLNNSTITDVQPISFYDGKIGNHDQRFTQINARNEGDYEVVVSSILGADKDYIVQAVFVVEK